MQFKVLNNHQPNRYIRYLSHSTQLLSKYTKVEKDVSYLPSLYYYLYATPNTPCTKLSFLPPTLYKPKQSPKQTIGHFPFLLNQFDHTKLDSQQFQPNSEFIQLVRQVIQDKVEQDIELENGMFNIRSGWTHILDFKQSPILHRVNDPENLLASVYFDQGKVIQSSLQFLDTHRILTPSLGLMKLAEVYHKELLSRMATGN